MSLTNDEKDIPTKPLLIVTLLLLTAAAFHQGAFQEVLARAGAMFALCLLHLALMGNVLTWGRGLVGFAHRLHSRMAASRARTDRARQSRYLQRAIRSTPSSTPQLALWTSGQCLAGTSPVNIEVSRI